MSESREGQSKISVVSNHWLGRKHTAESRAKMSASRKQIIGWKHAPETRAKIGRAHIGMKRSAETRSNISAARTGKPLTEKQLAQLAAVHRLNTGAKRSAEARQRITAGKIRKWAETPVDVRKRHMAEAIKASRKARPSSIEMTAWLLLTELGIDFASEHRIGPYMVDVFVPSLGLVIECDGEYWHRNTKVRDEKRDAYMTARGYRVLRVSELAFRSGAYRPLITEAVR